MRILILALIFLSSLSISHADPFSQIFFEDHESEENFINELISDFSLCIDRCSEDRIYLHSGNIESTSEGLVLKQGNKTLFLPIICSDRSGSYLPLSESAQTLSTTYCLGCGFIKFSGDSCRNKECPLYGK